MVSEMDRTLRLLVHGHPGTGPDVMAEALAEAFREADPGRTLEVVPMAGDGGTRAMRALLREASREDVLSTCTPSFLQTPMLEKLPFSFRDLTPIARLVVDWYLVLVPHNSNISKAEDFISLVRSRKTRTGGHFVGSINQLLGLAISGSLGSEVEFIPLKSTEEFISELEKGSIEWGVSAPVEVADPLTRGELRPLAVTAASRLMKFPDVPTLLELGVQVEFELWRGVMGPPALEVQAQERWWKWIGDATQTDAWRNYLTRHAQNDGLMAGEAFGDFLEAQQRWFQEKLEGAGLI
jgi:putative tricarboxylic transport membrane protein